MFDREIQPQSPAGGPGNEVAKRTLLACSYCGTRYVLEFSRFRPFCSQRCQQMDLRNWLTESYGLPYEDPASPLDEAE